MEHATDAELYSRIQQQDPVALEQLYDRYEKLLFSFAYKMTHHSESAEEIVQDVFMKLWQNKTQYDEVKGKFSSWILTITRYTTIDKVRKEKKEDTLEMEERDALVKQEPTSEDTLVWKEEREKLLEIVRTLSDEQRKIIDLFYFKGFTQKKIAEECGLALGTVKGRIRLALNHLRTRLQDERGAKS